MVGKMEIDWEQLWIETRENPILSEYYKSVKDHGVEEFWDRDARGYSDSVKGDDYEYGRPIIDAIKGIIKPDFDVLDVGAGPGTLAIPLAKKVKHVTALDASKEMLRVIEEIAAVRGIENIETINKTWQEVDDAKIMERFDLVISSNVVSLFEDVGDQLMRMHAASRKYCCVVLYADATDSHSSRLRNRITDEEYDIGIDYIYIYNILHSKGIYANVNIIALNSVIEKPVNDAIAYHGGLLGMEITPKVKKIIEDYVLENTVNGVYRGEDRTKEAVIWWEKEEG